jgi:hypothetical protein
MWCQGKVVDFIRESKDMHVFVRLNGVIVCERRRSEDHEKLTEKDEMESELTHCWSLARGFIS